MIATKGILTLTPTLVTAMRQCGHRELWLRRNPRQRPPFTESAASSRGTAMHAALAEFHRQGGAERFSPAELHSLLRFYWAGAGFGDPEEERLAQLQCEAELLRYYEVFGQDEKTLAVERTWPLLRDLEGIRTEWSGRLDWLRELPNGGIEIVDWKSGNRLPSEQALAADPVTTMYARMGRDLARRQMGWTGTEVRFSQLYLGAAEKVTVTVTREMVDAAETELARLAQALLPGGVLAAAEGPWCLWDGGCAVKALGRCPLFPPVTLDGEW